MASDLLLDMRFGFHAVTGILTKLWWQGKWD
jgi:hypothetical protein